MQKLGPRVVDVSTNHLGVRKPCDDSSPRVRFLHVLGFWPLRLHVYDKKALQPHFVISLARLSIAATYLLRDKTITILATLFYSLFYFLDLIEFGFIISLCSLQYLCVLSSICTLSFCSHINMDHIQIMPLDHFSSEA